MRIKSESLRDAIDRAYLNKYNTADALKYAKDLGRTKSRDTTSSSCRSHRLTRACLAWRHSEFDNMGSLIKIHPRIVLVHFNLRYRVNIPNRSPLRTNRASVL